MGENFIASYHQIGDFEVVKVNGKLQKNGGNVASYFCTPEGRVIHVTAKPVNADQLLREATWAVTTYRQVQAQKPTTLLAQRQLVEQAHLSHFNYSNVDFYAKVKAHFPRAQQRYEDKMLAVYNEGRRSSYSRKSRYKESPLLLARRAAAKSLGGDRAHQIMLAQPLAPFQEVYREVFEELTNERVTENRYIVYQAAEGFQKARETGKPVMFVLYDGHGENKDEPDSRTTKLYSAMKQFDKLITRTFGPALEQPKLGHYIKIAVPKRQLAALSNLIDLPVYELSKQSSPLLLMTDAYGQQTGIVTGAECCDQLAKQLWPAVLEVKLADVENLASRGELTPALKLLQRVSKISTSAVTHQRAQQLGNQIKFQVAEKTYANALECESAERRKIHQANALRKFSVLSRTAQDEGLRQRAEDYIAQLRGNSQAEPKNTLLASNSVKP